MKLSFPTALFTVAVLALAVPVQAAPAPSDEPAKIDKYLPDETGGVFVVDVKQILASKAFTKDVKKQIEDVLKMEEVQMVLKDSGFDPLKDVDRIIWAFTSRTEVTGPFIFVVEGRFDAKKLEAKAEQLSTQFPGIKPIEIGKTKAYEMSLGPPEPAYVALVDKGVLVFAVSKQDLTEAIEKAGGKRKTEFKSKNLAKLIAKMDPKLAVNVACAGEMPTGGSARSVPGGRVVCEIFTLADQGIESVTGGLTVGEDIQGKVNFTAKDAEGAKKLAAEFEAGIAKATAELTKQAEVQKELAPLIDVFKSLKVTTKEQTITIEGKGGADAVVATIKSWFTLRQSAPARVPPPPAAGK
jgi:hypothetical protein